MTDQRNRTTFGIKWFTVLVLVLLASARPPVRANTADEHAVADGRTAGTGEQSGILWQDPIDLESRDLFYGIGGEQHAPPVDGYTFVGEDASDSSPKFVVKDSNGTRWKVKLGPETRGEVAATRLVWAAGYFTDEDYYLPRLQVKNMPTLKRGKDLVSADGVVENVRMEREIAGQQKAGSWQWKTELWSNARPFNGLKIMMAVINNWDLKDNNNTVYRRESPGGGAEYIYAVSDLGASFGQNHLDRDATKANLDLYEASEFILKVDGENVRLATPGRPTPWLMVKPKLYFARRSLTSALGDIPRDDARWMGQLLSRLSPHQVREAFRAAGFSSEESDRFARVVERRIETLRGI